MNILHSLLCAAISLAAFGTGPATAAYPERPVRAIVTFVPGGPTDNIVRFIANGLSQTWGQSVVVENKGGAGGMIGAADIAGARPDGYTFGLLVTGHTIQPAIQASLPYDVGTAFAPITLVANAPKLVLARADMPATNLQELIELTKQSPEKYGAYGTSGIGSMAHLAMEQINQLTGAGFQHIPYKGGSATLSDLLGGRLPLAVLDLASVLPHVQSGALKVIAITGDKRSHLFPNLATVTESVPEFTATEWFGLAAPAGTPADIIEKISADVRDILKTPQARSIYVDQLGWQLVGSTPREMQQFMKEQVVFWHDIARKAGLSRD